MKKLLMLCGIPASGKSTFRKEMLNSNLCVGYVNKDEIRQSFTNKTHRFSKEDEKRVNEIEKEQLRSLFDKEAELIIIDNTNLTIHRYNSYKQLATDNGYEFEVKFMMDSFNVDLCHKRNMARPHDKHVPVSVIENMALNFYNMYDLFNKTSELDSTNPSAVLVDLDGTLAHMKNRSAFEWMRVGEDTLDLKVYELLMFYHSKGHKIVCVSGRDSVCRDITIEWLKSHNVMFDDLFMREENDSRKDSIVKWELYDKYIRPKYNLYIVLDDRNAVVRVWRGIGLKCLQVESGWF